MQLVALIGLGRKEEEWGRNEGEGGEGGEGGGGRGGGKENERN